MQGGVLRSYGAATLLRKEKSLVLFSKAGWVGAKFVRGAQVPANPKACRGGEYTEKAASRLFNRFRKVR
jgi:hypothetical protein